MGTNSNQVLGKRRCNKRTSNSGEDLFRRLPDGIFVRILSKLSSMEAVQTSVLSRRWEKLWTRSPNLCFFHQVDIGRILNDNSLIQESRQRFVRGVNNFLKLHQMATVDQFHIHCYMDSSCSSILDGWLQFAFRKRVQQLRLSICVPRYPGNNYTFPRAEILEKQLGICDLRVIELVCVDINQDTLEYLLFNCPFLELLSVGLSRNLTGLNVPSQAHRLKRLNVNSCRDMKRLAISKSNLTSLEFVGSKTTLSLGNVPLLSQLCVGGEHCQMFLQAFSLHSGLLSQLKKLSLLMSEKIVRESVFLPQEVPKLSNLEHLEVTMLTGDDDLCLLWPTILVKAAPFLHKFSVKFGGFFKRMLRVPELAKIRDPMYGTIRRRLEEDTKYTHQCLKVVELKCFFGSRNQVELAEQLLCMAGSLDKLVLDVGRSDFPYDWENLARKHDLLNLVEKHANEMRSKLPSGSEFILRK